MRLQIVGSRDGRYLFNRRTIDSSKTIRSRDLSSLVAKKNTSLSISWFPRTTSFPQRSRPRVAFHRLHGRYRQSNRRAPASPGAENGTTVFWSQQRAFRLSSASLAVWPQQQALSLPVPGNQKQHSRWFFVLLHAIQAWEKTLRVGSERHHYYLVGSSSVP